VHYDRIVIGYHGCDASVAKRLLDGEEFVPSVTDYDWLGTGVYFWEYGAARAYQFALDQQKRKKVTTPAVIGALIQLGRCFDLLDTRFTDDLAQAFRQFHASMHGAKIPLPKNEGKTPDRLLRRLDCAVLNWYFDQAAQIHQAYDTVRAGFVEGGPAYPGAGLMAQTHIQLAVRNPACIIGVFRPIL
jgi:hypothetical protein